VDEYLERRRALLQAGDPGRTVGGRARGASPTDQDPSARRPATTPAGVAPSRPDDGGAVEAGAVDVGGDGAVGGPPVTGAAEGGGSADGSASASPRSSQADQRDARKTIARIDRQLTKLANREEELHAQLVQHATDYEKLGELDAKLQAVLAEKEALEEEWLEAASLLE
jgi:hypothetical protein